MDIGQQRRGPTSWKKQAKGSEMTHDVAEPAGRTPYPFIGKQAVVVGAGIAGLVAAKALADWFEKVFVLEQDSLSDAPTYRMGTPQARHVHVLLVGGHAALEELFPGLNDDFIRGGSVPIRYNQDYRAELPNGHAMPQRDLGLVGFTMSRPLIESILRQRLLEQPNITLLDRIRALDLVVGPNGRQVTAVHCASVKDDRRRSLSTELRGMLPADLVVDASGRGQLTVSLLQSIGQPLPQETKIGLDLGYSTAIMDIPDDAPRDWKVVATRANAPYSTRGAWLAPIERNRWILTVGGFGSERPPAGWDEVLAFLQQLTTRTIFDAVKKTVPHDTLARFGFPASVRRHFERIEAFPDNLIPIGDAICRFNPAHGQGMTVAAREAVLLQRLLAARSSAQDPLAGFGQAFLAEAGSLIETPWIMAALPDLAFPQVRGERPSDLNNSLQFNRALFRIAARDEAVQRLYLEVMHMVKPASALQEPELVRRVEAEIAEQVSG
jgi:2-polyprenyl-6-methoxyphenol hydroxylase-like FAD-dependent oxidoreductase